MKPRDWTADVVDYPASVRPVVIHEAVRVIKPILYGPRGEPLVWAKRPVGFAQPDKKEQATR